MERWKKKKGVLTEANTPFVIENEQRISPPLVALLCLRAICAHYGVQDCTL